MASFTGTYKDELIATANAIAAPGKGILAADESTGTIGKRFAPINVENTQPNRVRYRELLFKTKGLGQYISGAITYEETLFDTATCGTPMVDLLKKEGIIPGIKVDKGVQPLFGTNGETVTQGIDDLGKRCAKYYAQGARFAKWRAVLKIDAATHCPTPLSIDQNAETLARYAAICQANGLVPIVEPEVLMDGTHSAEDAEKVCEKVLAAVYKKLSDHHVLLEGTLLKPNMVRSGESAATKCDMTEVAVRTVRCLSRTVPPAVPGITFLSGGMSEEDASLALQAMNVCPGKKPWSLTFSYGRALQQSVLKAWKGSDANIAAAQKELMIRSKANSEANLGTYKGGAGGAAATASTFVANYSY